MFSTLLNTMYLIFKYAHAYNIFFIHAYNEFIQRDLWDLSWTCCKPIILSIVEINFNDEPFYYTL